MKKKIVVLLIFCLIIVLCVFSLYYLGYIKLPTNSPKPKEDAEYIYLTDEKNDLPLKVTFLELFGNSNNPQIGDSIFIECGDVDILIDAGEKGSGSATVVPFIEQHVEDDILELIITTHADSDHIGGMVGLSSGYGALEVPDIKYEYIIDFSYEADSIVYKDYVELRNKQVENGAKYLDISDFFKDPKRFVLGNKAYLDLLDYKTYDMDEITDDNDRSVSCLLTHDENKILLCGDAEKKEEVYLTELNIGKVDVFKANHHGSKTSNTVDFLNNIKPDYVIISSSRENKYNLPVHEVVDRFYNYTNNVYATFESGNITVISNNNNITITSTRSLLPLKESDWYK